MLRFGVDTVGRLLGLRWPGSVRDVDLADSITKPDAVQQELIDFGTALLRAHSPQAQFSSRLLPDDDAVVVVQQGRGGLSAYVAADKAVLLMGSAVPPHVALEKFRAGERTPDRLT